MEYHNNNVSSASREKQLAEPEAGLEFVETNKSTVNAGYTGAPVPNDGSNTKAVGFGTKRNPWGLSPAVFGFLVAAITAVIVGAAIGGGVGSLAASRKSSCPSGSASSSNSVSTRTVTETASGPSATANSLSNYTVAAPNTISLLEVDCPNIQNGLQLTPRGDQFQVFCKSDMPVGSLDANGAPINDLVSITAYRFEDCIAACSNYNYYNGAGKCQGVSFRLDLINQNYANCYLHNGTSETSTSYPSDDVAMHGILQ